MDPSRDANPIGNLLIRLVENDLDDCELERLVEWSRTHPEAVREYCEFLKDYSLVRRLVAGEEDCHPDTPEEVQFNEAVWQALQEVENTAPGIRLPARRRPDSPAACPLPEARPRASRLSVAAILLSSAALFCLIIYAHFAMNNRPVEVATLSESLDANWSGSSRGLGDGMRLLTNSKPLWLREGMAAIDFDSGSRVVLEGPAEFEILEENRLYLHYGNLYAIIPPAAVGFTVDTDHSNVIDLGTEFGTRVDPDGRVEVHVMKGKTVLAAGPDHAHQSELRQGEARAVTAAGEVRDIAVSREAFVRLFEPHSRFVWKGRGAVDLADIVGGGNGFGSGRIAHGLDPLTGKAVTKITPRYSIHGSGRYQTAEDNPFVDGVFVPDGGDGSVVVSSRGDRFAGCPDTNGEFWTEITNGGQLSDPVELSSPRFSLQGQVYGTAERPAIFMHANLGVTFDLAAIRRSLPRLEITRFEALAGISENGPRRSPCADFRVLVDGEERFRQVGADGTGVYPVSVAIRESDRFLTLMVTDGGTERCLMVDGVPYVLDGDWGLFAMPRLLIGPE